MSMNVGGGGGGGRRSRFKKQPMAEINITPMVDVMLVLMIIFMVAAPMMTVGVPVDLPKTQKAGAMSTKGEPLTVTIKEDGSLFLQDKAIAEQELVKKLKGMSKNGFNERIFIRGHALVQNGRVMKIMSLVNSAGFSRIGFVTSNDDS